MQPPLDYFTISDDTLISSSEPLANFVEVVKVDESQAMNAFRFTHATDRAKDFTCQFRVREDDGKLEW